MFDVFGQIAQRRFGNGLRKRRGVMRGAADHAKQQVLRSAALSMIRHTLFVKEALEHLRRVVLPHHFVQHGLRIRVRVTEGEPVPLVRRLGQPLRRHRLIAAHPSHPLVHGPVRRSVSFGVSGRTK